MCKILQPLLLLALLAGLSNAAHSVTYMAATGDSITSGYEDVICARGKQKYGGYSQYLEPLLDNSGWSTTLYNYGIAGDRAEWAYKTHDKHCDDESWSHNGQSIRHNQLAVALARSPKPEYILYLFGTNDLGHHSAPTVVAYIQTGVNMILNAGTIPIVGTIIPDTRSKGDIKDITGANSSLRAWLNSIDVQIAEFYYATSISGWENLLYDGLHPGSNGQRFMADIWFDALNEDKEKKAAAQRARIAGSMAGINLLLLDD